MGEEGGGGTPTRRGVRRGGGYPNTSRGEEEGGGYPNTSPGVDVLPRGGGGPMGEGGRGYPKDMLF